MSTLSFPPRPAAVLPAAALGLALASAALAHWPGAIELAAVAVLLARRTAAGSELGWTLGGGLLACGLGDLLLASQFKTALLLMASGQALVALALWSEAAGPGRRLWLAVGGVLPAWVAAVQVPQLPPSLALIALLYCLASAAMAGTALARALRWGGAPAWGLAAGAGLFIASDALLTWDRYLSALPWAGVLVPGAYYASQLLLAWHGRPMRLPADQVPVTPRRLPQA